MKNISFFSVRKGGHRRPADIKINGWFRCYLIRKNTPAKWHRWRRWAIILMMIKINKHSALVFRASLFHLRKSNQTEKMKKKRFVDQLTFDELLQKRKRKMRAQYKRRNVNCSGYKFLLILLRSVKYIYLTGRTAHRIASFLLLTIALNKVSTLRYFCLNQLKSFLFLGYDNFIEKKII